MQKRSSVVILIVAIVCGLVGVYFVMNYVGSVESVYKDRPMQEVVVAAQYIPENITITKGMLQVMTMPTEYVLPQTYEDMEEIVGAMTTTFIHKGEQIVSGRTSKGETRAGFSYGIPEGKRAVSLSINPVSGVSGFINPKDRVDILVTLSIPDHAGASQQDSQDETEEKVQVVSWAEELILFQRIARKLMEGRRIVSYDGKTFTFTLFQNIEVLAVGKHIIKSEEDDAGSANTITLCLDPEEVELLTNAEFIGTIKFDLRNPADEEIVELEPIVN